MLHLRDLLTASEKYRKEGSEVRQLMLLNYVDPTSSIYKAVDLEKYQYSTQNKHLMLSFLC